MHKQSTFQPAEESQGGDDGRGRQNARGPVRARQNADLSLTENASLCPVHHMPCTSVAVAPLQMKAPMDDMT